MSYVRSGPDSDVYLYGSRTELCLHIAYNRGRAGRVPMPRAPGTEAAWEAYWNDVIEWDHPEAGKSYFFTSRSGCVAKLEELRDSGVRVPQRPFDRLREEIEDEGDVYQ